MSGAVLDLFLELAAIESPPGQERAVADRVIAELRALGLEVDEDDAGLDDRLDDREPALSPAGRVRRRYADLPLRSPRHGAAAGAARARGRRGRHRPERGRDDPWSGQQVGRRGDDRGRATDRRGRPAARGRRAPLHAEGGGRPDRCGRLRSHDARGRARLRLRPGGSDRRGGHGRALPALDARPLSRPAGPLGDGPGGGAVRDRGGSACDRRPAARQARRGDDSERRR